MAMRTKAFENAGIGFRNFSGKEGRFNPAGRRNFCLFLDPEEGREMEEEGWNVKWLEPRDEGDVATPFIQVSVSYNKIAPKIVLIKGRSKVLLNEEDLSILDYAEIENVDLILNASNWSVNDRTGIKAYLRSLYITIVEDEFEAKYSDCLDSAQSAICDDRNS